MLLASSQNTVVWLQQCAQHIDFFGRITICTIFFIFFPCVSVWLVLETTVDTGVEVEVPPLKLAAASTAASVMVFLWGGGRQGYSIAHLFSFFWFLLGRGEGWGGKGRSGTGVEKVRSCGGGGRLVILEGRRMGAIAPSMLVAICNITRCRYGSVCVRLIIL